MKKITCLIGLVCFLSFVGASNNNKICVNGWISAGGNIKPDLCVNKYVNGKLDSFVEYNQNQTTDHSFRNAIEYRIVGEEQQMVSNLTSIHDNFGNLIYVNNDYYEDGEITSSLYENNRYNRENLVTNKEVRETNGSEIVDGSFEYDYLYGPYILPIDCKKYSLGEERALVEHHIYTYNSSYLLESDTKYTIVSGAENKEALYTYEYNPATELKVSEDVYLFDNDVESHLSHETWEYDTNKNLTKHVLENIQENTSNEELFEYDDKSRNTKHSLYFNESNGNKVLNSLFEYEYYKDTNEYSKESSLYYSEGQLQKSYIMTYEFSSTDTQIEGRGTETDKTRGIESANIYLEYLYKPDYKPDISNNNVLIESKSENTIYLFGGIGLILISLTIPTCLLIVKKKKTKKLTNSNY